MKFNSEQMSSMRLAGPSNFVFEEESAVEHVRFNQADLRGESLLRVEIDSCAFDGVRLAHQLRSSVLRRSQFDHSDLANVVADDCSLLDIHVSNSRLTGMRFLHGVVRDSTIEGCRADIASFRDSRIKNVRFERCDMTSVDFQRANLHRVVFSSCNLEGAQFNSAKLSEVRFHRCSLLNVSGVRSLQGATVGAEDLISLAASLASEIGIKIEDPDG